MHLYLPRLDRAAKGTYLPITSLSVCFLLPSAGSVAFFTPLLASYTLLQSRMPDYVEQVGPVLAIVDQDNQKVGPLHVTPPVNGNTSSIVQSIEGRLEWNLNGCMLKKISSPLSPLVCIQGNQRKNFWFGQNCRR